MICLNLIYIKVALTQAGIVERSQRAARLAPQIYMSPQHPPSPKPLVYACAGCSQVARLAYDLAKDLDRRGLAEMSCLAGLGAGKRAFTRMLDGRSAWVIDGCPIECGLGVFERNKHAVGRHIRLFDLGYKKNQALIQGYDMDELIQYVLSAPDNIVHEAAVGGAK